MPAIKLSAFSGEQPRIIPRLLPPNAATSAVDARLEDGSLTPYRVPSFVANLEEGGPYNTIYKHGTDWLAWEGTVNAAPGPVAADRLYYTGDGVPKLRVGEDEYGLAVPAPTTAPTATEDTGGSGDVQTRAYCYTFVTAFGEESEPSPASSEIEWQPGEDPVLSGIEDDPGDRNITKQRFYRTQSGSLGTDFYLIAERDVSDSNFTDDVAVDEFAEPLPSRYWNPPPDDLVGLIAAANGMMAGFVGKTLYISEPYRPHAWPEIYTLTMKSPIVALAAAGTSIWVLTTGFPNLVTGTTPDSLVAEEIEANLPCLNARAVVDLGHAVAWPSVDGLAAASGGGAKIVSGNLFTQRAWTRLNPGTMRAAQLNGRWITAYDAVDDQGNPVAGSLIIDLYADSYLIRTGVQARAWFYELETGALYFIPPDLTEQVWRFDPPGGDLANYYWRSKRFVLPHAENFGAILVESGAKVTQADIDARQAEIDAVIAANAALIAAGSVGGEVMGEALMAAPIAGDLLEVVPGAAGTEVTVSVYADNEIVGSVAVIDRVKRLPSGFKARIWELDVFGDVTIDQITIAKTVDELKVASGGP